MKCTVHPQPGANHIHNFNVYLKATFLLSAWKDMFNMAVNSIKKLYLFGLGCRESRAKSIGYSLGKWASQRTIEMKLHLAVYCFLLSHYKWHCWEGIPKQNIQLSSWVYACSTNACYVWVWTKRYYKIMTKLVNVASPSNSRELEHFILMFFKKKTKKNIRRILI